MYDRPLIGTVFERTARPPSAFSPKFNGTPGAGFPTAQHRTKSKSAFARAREGGGGVGKRVEGPPVVVSARPPSPSPAPPTPNVDPIPTDTDALRRQIDQENGQRIARMSDADIEAGKRAIFEQLGEGTGELMRRVLEARRRKEVRECVRVAQEEGRVKRNGENEGRGASIASPAPLRVPHGLAAKPGVLRVKSLENISRSVPSPLPATSSTRPSSRTGRKLRFAEVTPDDVHVYESAPRSPKRILALPPPPDTKDASIVSLGTYNKNVLSFKRSDKPPQDNDQATDGDEVEEGTPEYIRRRYFPTVPANDPNLAWMDASQDPADASVPRFDLHGAPIPLSLTASLPSHLGLHHHAEGSLAGYTLDDIFLLSRSTVPAQRASMLGVLAKITRRLGRQVRDPDSSKKIAAFVGQEGLLRKRILAAGLAAMDQIGSLGARAVEVVWECLVEWDGTTNDLEGIELNLAPDVLSLLQLDYFLPQLTDVLSHAALPPESLAQLLAVVHWLAQQSNAVADSITNTSRLVPTILDTFLLAPIPPREGSLSPNPLALQLLITLASASRANASTLVDPADALLRFITLLPPSSPYPPALASTLATYTLRFYTVLASYGLYAHIATAAAQVFTALAAYIHATPANMISKETIDLRTAWANLVEAWIICAINPHATTPPHEILWSQICAWGWPADVRKLRDGLGDDVSLWPVHAAIWDAEAAWLEGARINGVKGGEAERQEALQALRRDFSSASEEGHEEGTAFRIVTHAVETVHRSLDLRGQPTMRVLESLASAGGVLASSLRLFLACLPPLSDGSDTVPRTPPAPFALPLSILSALCTTLVKHPIWSVPHSAPHIQVHLRPLTRLLTHFHRVLRFMPGTTPQLWFAQALVFLERMMPGDESGAVEMFKAFGCVTPECAGIDDKVSAGIRIDVGILRPFFEYGVRGGAGVSVAPVRPSIESISGAGTLRLFSSHTRHFGSAGTSEVDEDATGRLLGAGLPLGSDMLFSPLTHLLRSGTSPVFRKGWSASEVEVVRATLVLVGAARRALEAFGLEAFGFGGGGGAAEVVFGCMRVCMLEHGVGGEGEEVFRDQGVEWLMRWLLEAYTVRGRQDQQHRDEDITETKPTRPRTLEDVSKPYLGTTPFYQFYTDLVALYGAVSFGQHVFGSLVVTPLAMGYPVDYRRALWCGGEGGGVGGEINGISVGGDGAGTGLSDVVRSVRIPIEDVVCTGLDADPREYLYPIERDAGVLGAYVAALVARERGVEGFLRYVAVHHVACTVWGEEDTSTEDLQLEMRAKMLRTVLVRGEVDVVRDVLMYQQRARGVFVWPPACYRGGWREERLTFVRQVMGDSAVDRVQGLLIS